MYQEQYITVEPDIKLFVETLGNPKNQACLFISGAGANSSFWSDNLCSTLVEEGFFVIKYDHRDFGYSSKIDWDKHPYDFMQLALDAVAILDALQVERTHVIGHSMGGFVAQLLAIYYPGRLISMISISSSTSSPTIPPPPPKTWEIYLANHPQNDLEKDLDGFMTVWEYLNGTAQFDRDLGIEYTRNIYKRQGISGALGETHVKAQATLTDRTKELNKVRLPVLVMHGEEDYAMDKKGGIETAQAIKNAKLVMIPRLGHMPFNYQLKVCFENEIIDFIVANKEH